MGSHEQWLRTVFLLLAARTWTHTEPPNVTGEETVYGPTGDSNRGPLAYRARTQTTELKSHTHRRPVTISIHLIRFISESTRNHAGTNETVSLLPAVQTWTHTEPQNVKGEEQLPTRICFLRENWCLPSIGVMQFCTESQVLVQQRGISSESK